VSIALDRWQLGILGAFEMQYFDLTREAPGERRSSAIALGVLAGRREPVGNVEIVGGARLSFALLEHKDDDRGRGQVRLGAYGGIVWPRQSPLRFRADLAAEISPEEQNTASSTAVASAPQWASLMLAGIEVGGR
jgi:hypothetical protein